MAEPATLPSARGQPRFWQKSVLTTRARRRTQQSRSPPPGLRSPALPPARLRQPLSVPPPLRVDVEEEDESDIDI